MGTKKLYIKRTQSMKKILLGTAVALLLLTGCNEEKKAPAETQTTQEVKKVEVTTTPVQTQTTEEVKKEEVTTTPVQTPATEEKKEETK
jgi:PBP1b-binding outer membrane lipoprotein LpoB